MHTLKPKFLKMDLIAFRSWIRTVKVERTIRYIQQHHTWIPDSKNFNGTNHTSLQLDMRNFHVQHNRWDDIGQHFTIFPDGLIMTGRDLDMTPACILGNNLGAICIENLGNFDNGKDEMLSAQKDAIIGVTAAICHRFGIMINTENIVYHHWFDSLSGVRNNGKVNTKTCPGSGFFGGNKIEDCERNFLPLVRNEEFSLKESGF